MRTKPRIDRIGRAIRIGHRAAGRAAVAIALLAAVAAPAPLAASGDLTPPIGSAELWAFDSTTQVVEFQFHYSDPESGLDHIAVTCDGSAEFIIPYAATVLWQTHDGSGGCTTAYGQHDFWFQVFNGDGLTGNGSGVSVVTGPSLHLDVSAAPTTGGLVTITPVFSADFVVPVNDVCNWEFRWGNTKSLDQLDFDETFGGMYFEVPASAGGCAAWTLRLPWVPVRQFDVRFQITNPGNDASFESGTSAQTRFVAAVGSTERRILSSNLPIAQVLPSTFTPIVGAPITYTRYLVGSAAPCCDARWVAHLGSSETPLQWTQTGGATFTFTPTTPGDLLVEWTRTATEGHLISSYYDPPVRYRDTSPPNTSAPVARLAAGAVGSTLPISVGWTGTDHGWGIASYQLQESLNGGAWHGVVLPSATTRSVIRRLAPGTAVRYRVRARDKAGNLGAWDVGPTITVRTASDSNVAVHYLRTWTRRDDVSAVGGSLHDTVQSGASSSYTVSARDVAWIAERGLGHGKARVYLDGILVATIDLGGTIVQPGRIVFTRHFATLATHTIRIVGLATAGRPLVSVDGFAILR